MQKLSDPGLKRTRLKVLTALTAFISALIVMLVLVMYYGTRLGGRYTPMLDVALHVKMYTTSAHLWIEEIISGDESENIDIVWSYLNAADYDITNLLAGGPTSDFQLTPRLDEHLRTHFINIKNRLGEFRTLAERRYGALESSGVGTTADLHFDTLYRELIDMADHVEGALESYVARDLFRYQALLFSLILGCVMLLVYLIWLTNYHFTRLGAEIEERRRSEEELRASELRAIRARDEANAANKTKDLFLAKVSHEVRTPLNSIAGMSTLLGDTQLGAEQREYLRILDEETRALTQIVEDLLDSSKIEANRVDLSPRAFDMRHMVADTVELFRPKAVEQKLLLDFVMSPDFPGEVVGDALRLRQILLNLLRNAFRFTHSGSVTVELDWQPADRSQSNARVVLKVIDTGVGVVETMQEKIFEAFTQAGADASHAEGLGLGLSICRELIALMGGSIYVSSEIGRGSVFWIDLTLPIARAAPPLSEASDARVLVVDREDGLRDHTVELLRRVGAGVRVVAGLEAAASEMGEAAQQGEPVTVLLLAERLKEDGDTGELLDAVREAARSSVRVMMQLEQSSLARGQRYRAAGAVAAFGYLQRALLLPALLYESGEAPVPRTAPTPARAGGSRCHARVLLVDDHPVTQIAARHMLESLGCEVTSAHNGTEALRHWQEGDSELILLDTQMPDMDGTEVAKRIRELERRSHRPPVPIVAITANATPEHRAVCLAAGMDGHLPKPVRREALRSMLEEFLASARQHNFR